MKLIRLIQTALALLTIVSGASMAAPEAKLLPFWDSHQAISKTVIPHDKWQALLGKYLDSEHDSGVSRFDYAAVSSSDKKDLNAYIRMLEKIDPRSLNRNEQLAYWLNLYNALTVNVVLKHYPVSSIKKIRYVTSLFGPWDKNLVTIQGQKLSLNDIEHRILRPVWNDPRIHFVVNCASIGCPNLMSKAFSAENVDKLMDEATASYINHSRAVEVQGSEVTISSIFEWYRNDFANNEQGIIEYIKPFVSEETRSALDNVRRVSYRYDWSLNEG